ncbi:MAG: phosphatidylglycerol lysyltransferase domain-containing protein [Desulfobacteraceae bacterium]|nr:phosphatidylglycerol lysyltransferase domain-containing protein [Desulfobacteraceae bacterium]
MDFQPIQLERQDAYREKLAQCGQIASDYSFINIWGWGPEYELSWAWEKNLVWIRQSKPEPALWAPVGDWSAVDWRAALSAATSVTDQLIRVPEKLLHHIEQSFSPPAPPIETRDHWDYLYSVPELVDLKGNRFHKKKNLLKQFQSSYDYEYMDFGPEMIDQALAMQEDWCSWRDCESVETLASENKAISRVLNDWNQLKAITGGAIQVKGVMAAYTIAETMADHSIVIHFEKGCPDFKGSYQAINQMFLAHAPQGYPQVNREQDLGDEGLRKAKLSYNPVDFIKKYKVKL